MRQERIREVNHPSGRAQQRGDDVCYSVDSILVSEIGRTEISIVHQCTSTTNLVLHPFDRTFVTLASDVHHTDTDSGILRIRASYEFRHPTNSQ